MKLTHQSFMLSIEEAAQVGELKATLVAQVMGSKDSFDIEFMDIIDITYMGIEIKGYQDWKKFRDFHKGMGIDYDAHLNALFDEIFTTDAVKEIVKKIKF